MRAFEKEDIAGMMEVEGEISKAAVHIVKLDAQEVEFTGAIKREKGKFDKLKEQAADFDQDELTDVRLALRPQMERTAHDRIRAGLSSGKVSFWGYEGSKKDANRWLGEEGMAERHEVQRRHQMRNISYRPNRKSKQQGQKR